MIVPGDRWLRGLALAVAVGMGTISPAWAGEAEAELEKQLKEVWAGPALRRGTTAIYVVDEGTGEPLFAVHEKEPLNPASNVKLLSTAAMLETLGPDWHYQTRVLGPNIDANGTVDGDLYLLGSGDPTFGLKSLERLAARVAERTRRITGGIVIGAAPIRDAVVRAGVKVHIVGNRPGERPTVTIEPAIDELFEVEVTATSVARRRGRASVVLEATGDEGARRIRVSVGGSIRHGRDATVWRVVPLRATFTAHAFKYFLSKAGVAVEGGVRVESEAEYASRAAQEGYLPIVIASHRSKPLSDLVAIVNKRSHNFLADRLTMTVGAALLGGLPEMAKGVAVMEAWAREQAGVRGETLEVDTGSGLSYATKMSARQIVAILRAASGVDESESQGRKASAFLRSLAVAGRDGTLRRRFRSSPVKGKMIGKTGTLTKVIALSGFVSDVEGDERLCFSIVSNGHRHRRRQVVRREHEALVEVMQTYLEARKRAEEPEALGGAVMSTTAAKAQAPSAP